MYLALERLTTQPMASGNVSLLLTDCVDWDSFPGYADEVVRLVNGVVIDRVDGADQRLWTVRIDEQLFWLTYDEFPVGVSLDPQTSEASALIEPIRQKLLEFRAVH